MHKYWKKKQIQTVLYSVMFWTPRIHSLLLKLLHLFFLKCLSPFRPIHIRLAFQGPYPSGFPSAPATFVSLLSELWHQGLCMEVNASFCLLLTIRCVCIGVYVCARLCLCLCFTLVFSTISLDPKCLSRSKALGISYCVSANPQWAHYILGVWLIMFRRLLY